MTIPHNTDRSRRPAGCGDVPGAPSSPGIRVRILAVLVVVGTLTCDWLAPANQAPQGVGTIADREVQVDSMVTVDVAGYFTDPDGDSLRYAARSSDLAPVAVVAAGSTVTVTGVAAGSATVTVTATDPEGLSAQQRFGVTVPNRAPVTVGTIEDLEVEVDSVAVVGIAGYFADPDGDELAYAAVSSDSARATVAVAGDTVAVTGVAKGSVTVTVTATDHEGLSAEQRFGVTVPNRAPVAVGTMADLEVEVDSAVAVELAGHFADPDGDELEYVAVSSDTMRVGVAVVGGTVTVTGVAKGGAIVTITATDTGGLSEEQSFAVTVPNRAPVTVGTIADLEVEVDSAAVVAIAMHFADPDGDALAYAAVSSDSMRAVVGVTGDTLTVSGLAKGSVTVTVTATDSEGLSAELVFGVTVPNRAPAGVGTIADLEVEVDSAAVVGIAAYFTDPDGDSLAYSASSSDTTKASIEVTGSTATLTGVAKGSVMITLLAQDPEGLSAEQHFAVTVPNRSPEAVGTIADLEVQVDSAVEVEVLGHFTDPDGDPLEYSVVSSDPARATAAVTGSAVTVAGVAKGRVTVTVAAEDPEGLAAEQSFEVRVPNRPPVVVGTIADLEVEVDSVVAADVARYFRDPDGDVLEYAAVSSNTTRAAVSVAGSTVTVTGVGKGSATVTVMARDSEGLSAEQQFGVRVPNRAPRPVGTIADLEVEVDSAAVVEIAAYFTDPDGDPLAYSAASSDASKASITVTGSTVTVAGVSKGHAAVTLVAQDAEGLSAEQHFAVTVPNRAPGAVGTIADLVVEVDGVTVVDVLDYFTDPDGDPLEYSVRSSDSARATVTLTGTVVAVAGVAKGSVTVTVAAEDPEGLAAEQYFGVTVPNRPPGAVGSVADLEVRGDSVVAVDVADYFADPDGDMLEYTAESSDTSRAAVSVTGSLVAVTGVRKGNAAVTVTATDPEGLSAQQSFAVTVPNRAPDAVGSIRNRVVARGNTITVDASSHFADPDGDELVFSATSSRTRIATVSVSGDAVVVTGRAVGTTTITVTAHDSAGLAAEQRFDVTVPQPNRPPRASGTISDRSAAVNTEVSVDVSPNFTDPDGDPLTYSATSSNTSVATVSTSGGTVTITTESAGRSTITVTARDPDGLEATQSFRITVRSPNRAPVRVRRFADIPNAIPGEAYEASLTGVFEDPDGDPLTHSVSSTNTAVAEPEIRNDSIFVATHAVGSATITITATDPEGLSASDDFEVTVVGARFDIDMGWTGDVTETHLAWIRAAREGWESVLRDTELADVNMPDEFSCLSITATAQQIPTVDDHLVLIDVRAVDGARGTLAFAGYCRVRGSDGTPVLSAIVFDEADIDRVANLGSLGMLAFHEFAHGLGFFDNYWEDLGLLDTSSDPHFTGALAIAAFDAAGGTTYADAKVPISAPDYSHWREDVFGLEGMTPRLTVGVPNPFSAITLQAMADAGYVVDASLADDYRLPNTVPPDVAADAAGQVLDLSNDVVRGPVMVLDDAGNIVRVIPPPPGATVPSWPRREAKVEPVEVRNGAPGEAGQAVPAREIMWQRVTRRVPSGRSR